MTKFIAISTEVIDGRLAYIGTSAGRSLEPEGDEIGTNAALDFLFSLHSLLKRKAYKGAVFVWYSALLDVELILRDLPPAAKDIAFPSIEVKRIKRVLREEVDRLRREAKATAERIKASDGTETKRLEDTAARLAKDIAAQSRGLHELEYIYTGKYRLKVRQGKALTIYRINDKGKAHRGLTIYDLYSFFNKSLPDTARQYLGYSPPALDRTLAEHLKLSEQKATLPLWQTEATAETVAHKAASYRCSVKEYVAAETDIVVKLARRMDDYFTDTGIRLKRWYGASAVTNLLLNRWNVCSQFWRASEENTPRELWHAINNAYYGGRREVLKLGTVTGVYVYDINSAYAYAASLLAQINKRWHYTRQYNPYDLFALWHVEYSLPDSAYIGVLPHRTSLGTVIYRQRGRGWYHAPEVRELARRYPESFTVSEGYTLPYSRVSFGTAIEELYNHRQALRAAGEPGEKLFKLVLASIYGKFAQTTGLARYRSTAWAGWITSFVRATLLEAVAGQEQDVIYFADDALHMKEPLNFPIRVGSGLGEWKAEVHERSTYLQGGVYEHSGGKTATRGYDCLDFKQATLDLSRGLPAQAGREYIVGWRLSQQIREAREELRHTRTRLSANTLEPWREAVERFPGRYLERVSETVNLNPLAAHNRQFDESVIMDWSDEYIDSEMLKHDDGRESAPRRVPDYSKRLNMMLATVEARRY